ncbi:nucleotide exchange factor GrpE [Cellulomonas sp. PhB143]|uniref:nucleotide exchange factor GrpE n=1 Tax=Cellulomonas sp. PhB143 TaxID=2485186 RepID=UPI000F47E510|nr:nucleotide exchange factor GrpE [Cellulomonas sp. PhB143]ROS72081.1 molecular chaperone GrpE [Cellulomonas sp. PhB143]
MTADDSTPREGEQGPEDSSDAPFHFTDKRKVDPESGQARESGPASGEGAPAAGADDAPAAGEPGDPLEALDFEPEGAAAEDAAVIAAKAEAAQHLDALQRERASFTNYRNRAVRDNETARTRGTQDVLTALLPVLDDIERARTHGELTGPFVAISEKLEGALAKFGIERFGEVGEEFDPNVHEALMHRTDAEATSSTVELVVEPGYRIGDKVVRAARVGVVGPE